MTGDENQSQQVISNIVVESRIQIGHSHLFRAQLATKLLVLALDPRISAEVINGTMLGGGHEPSAGIVRNARLRPLLERRDQSILRKVLGKAHIADDSHKARDEPRRLDPPDRIDGAMYVGRHHSYRSHHF